MDFLKHCLKYMGWKIEDDKLSLDQVKMLIFLVPTFAGVVFGMMGLIKIGAPLVLIGTILYFVFALAHDAKESKKHEEEFDQQIKKAKEAKEKDENDIEYHY